MKAHGRIHAESSYTRRRWANLYVVMVIVCSVLVCGILGLHRIREKRSFSLLINQKDDQILSLHLLLQKERERLQEVKRKTEEMKMEIMGLGSEKAELNSRIFDMQSKISSLREEQRAVEVAFQEKQNEVSLLREKVQDSQVEALMEDLRHKDTEIGDLKQRLQLCGAEIGAVAGQERLIQPSNATTAENRGGDVEVGKEKNAGETDSSITTSKEETETDRSSENGGTNADGSEKKVDHEKIEDLGHQVQNSEEGEDEAHVTARGGSSDNQEMEVHEGRMKLEMQENTHKVRGKRGYLRRVKGKRWRSIAKQARGRRASPSNAASTMADQGLVQGENLSEIERGEAKSNIGGTDEEMPQGNELRGSIHGEDTVILNHNEVKNLTSEETDVSHQELVKKPAMKMEDTGSAQKNAEENEHQRNELPGRSEGKPDAVQRGDPEESEVGGNNEEKEEADEQEF